MVEKNLTELLSKVKSATKQAANATVRQAKIARLRFDLMALHSEKAKHLQNMGTHLYSLYKQKATFDQTAIFSNLEIEIGNTESVDRRIEAIEAQLEAQQADNIEVKDVTPE
jgi:hypothetical protein